MPPTAAIKPKCVDYASVALDKGLYAIIDPEDLETVSGYKWRAERFKCSHYAVAEARINGRKRKVRMHRLIAKTPRRFVCHHKNHNSLDNRRKNLVNMTPNEHMIFHTNNTIRIKFAR